MSCEHIPHSVYVCVCARAHAAILSVIVSVHLMGFACKMKFLIVSQEVLLVLRLILAAGQ